MKQTITPEQLNELSDRGKKKFVDYVVSKGAKNWSELYEHEKGYCLPLLTIGEMIEFVGKHLDSIEKLKDTWIVYTEELSFIEKEELTDALFEAVKEVLNK